MCVAVGVVIRLIGMKMICALARPTAKHWVRGLRDKNSASSASETVCVRVYFVRFRGAATKIIHLIGSNEQGTMCRRHTRHQMQIIFKVVN